jgi:hypothetical protein
MKWKFKHYIIKFQQIQSLNIFRLDNDKALVPFIFNTLVFLFVYKIKYVSILSLFFGLYSRTTAPRGSKLIFFLELLLITNVLTLFCCNADTYKKWNMAIFVFNILN